MEAVVKYSSGDVRLDPALGTSRIFRTLKRNLTDRERERLDVKFQWGEVELHFRGPSALDIADQSVLLAVIEVGQTHLEAAQRAADEAGRQRVAAWLNQVPFDPEGDQVLIRTSFRELVRLSRPDAKCGGESIKSMRQSLRRLAETTVWQRHGKVELASRLLAWRIGDAEFVELALNARLVQVLLGRRYRPVNLDERAQLDGDLAKHIHFMWSCSVNHAASYSVSVDRLRLHVYGKSDGTEDAPATIRQQRKRVLDAVLSIAALERWDVQQQGHRIDVTRKARKKGGNPLVRRVQFIQPASPASDPETDA